MQTSRTAKPIRNRTSAEPAGPRQIVLSASRRTDIPGGYTPWFMAGIETGRFDVINPFNRSTRRVGVSPEMVHTIVFWSKNYGPFLDLKAHARLAEMGFNLFFNFTVNTPDPLLEPGIPGLDRRLAQAAELAGYFDPAQIAWRFDPICLYRQNGNLRNNLGEFEKIADTLSNLGIKRCITSFYDPYKKVEQRIRRMVRSGDPMVELIPPSFADRQKIIRRMADGLAARSMTLSLCCEKDLAAVPDIGATPSACIDGRLYRDLFGGNPDTSADAGQRRKQGCRCTRSVDIGSYDTHPCFHNCLFCYARTGLDTIKGKDT